MKLIRSAAGKTAAIFACTAILISSLRMAGAQIRNHSAVAPMPPQEQTDRTEAGAGGPDMSAPLRELGETVAIVPWNYKNSRDAAVQSAHEVCSQLLLGTGFNVFLIKSATGAMPPPMSGISGS